MTVLFLALIGAHPGGRLSLAQEDARPRIEASVAASNLVSKVAPAYPALARAARVTGTVVLEAVLDKGGHTGNIKVVRGHTLLNDSAMEAVRQWRYKPHDVNGRPADVVTTITLHFALVDPPRIPSGSASISGRVLHADGKPAVGFSVDVVLATPVEVRPATPVTSFTEVSAEYRLEVTANALLRAPNRTDSSGEYRISGLGAANYRVVVRSNEQAFYYPGTPAAAEALSIPVESNQVTLVGIDFSIP